MKKVIIILFTLVIPAYAMASSYGMQTKTSGCVGNRALPDSSCTPGAVFTVSTSTICTVGYTTKVRDVPLYEKKQVFKEYGISYTLHTNYEVDHLISLELGGSNDISNLWPESYIISNGSRTKDSFENYLHSQVCKGSMTLAEAQREISSNWTTYDNIRRGIQNVVATPITTTISNVHKLSPSLDILNPAVKKSTAGLCHALGTRYYAATKTFTSYTSLQTCFDSGGRL